MRKLYMLLFAIAIIGLRFLLSFIFVGIFNVENKNDVQLWVLIAIDVSYLIAFICLYLFVKSTPKFFEKSIPKISLYVLLAIALSIFSPCLNTSAFFNCDLKSLFDLNFNLTLDYSILRTIIIFPILEELIFRKYIFSYIATSRKSIPISIIFTSLLFAFMHLEINHIIYFFLCGVLLSLIYLRSRTIIVPIIVHAFLNILTIIL